MADQVEVKLGADTGPVQSSVSAAADSVAASLAKMADELAKFTATNKRTTDEAIRNNANLSRSFVELRGSVQSGFNAIAGTIERFRGVSASLLSILGGGALFREAIASVSALEESVRSLETTMGMTSDKATQYALALKLGGTSTDAFTSMALRVGRVLLTQGEEFDRLKVSVKDASGNLLPMEQILDNVYKRMQDFKAGADQDMFALSTVGRNAKEFADTMRELHENLDRAAQMQRELGIEMGPARAAEIRAYHTEMNALKITFEEISAKGTEKLIPALKNLATWFNSEGPTAMSYFADAAKVVMTVFTALGYLIAATGRNIGTTIAAVVAHFGYMADAVKALGRLDWAGVWQAAKGALDNVRNYASAQLENVVTSTKNAIASINKLWAEQAGPKPAAGAGPVPSGSERFVPKPGPGAATQLDVWKQELAEMQMAAGYFREFDKAQEAAFWESKLALVKKGTKDYVEVYRLMFDARKADAREQLATALETMQREIDEAKNNRDEQLSIAHSRTELIKATFGEESKEFQRALDDETRIRQAWAAKDQQIVLIRMKMQQAQAEHAVEMEQMAADQAVALGRMSADQRFAIEAELENRLYALKVRAAQDALAAEKAGPNDPVKIAELNAQIEALEMEHQKRLTDIANKAALERMQYALQAQQAVESGIESLMSKLVEQPKNWKQAFLDAAKSIASELDKIAAKQIFQKFMGAGTAGGNWLSDALGKIFGGGESSSLSTAGVTLTTAGTSLTAAAAALSSAAGAMAFGGGGMFSDIVANGLGSFIPFFATGTPYVPRDTLAVIHRGEAVIPANMNKPGRGGSFGSVAVVNNFNVTGDMINTRTQAQMAMQMARSAEQATRRNR